MNDVQEQPVVTEAPRQRASWWIGVPILLAALAGVGAYALWAWNHATNFEQRSDVVELPPNTPPTVAPPVLPPPRMQDPGATLVTLRLANATPEEAFAQLSKQAEFEFKPMPANLWQQVRSKRVTLTAENEPFWTVFLKLCGASTVYPQFAGERSNAMPLVVDTSDRWKCPSVLHGSCMVVLNRITESAQADLVAKTVGEKTLALQMTLFTEPKVRLFHIAHWATVEEAVDEAGNSLVGAKVGITGITNMNPYVNMFYARLSDPPKTAQRIAKVKGFVPVMAYSGQEVIEIPDVLKAQGFTKTIDGMSIEYKALEKSDRGYMVSFIVRAENRDPNVMRRFGNPGDMVTLKDSKDAPYRVVGTGSSGSGRGVYTYTVHFSQPPQAGEPAKATITVPVGIKELIVPFEFTDLPLP